MEEVVKFSRRKLYTTRKDLVITDSNYFKLDRDALSSNLIDTTRNCTVCAAALSINPTLIASMINTNLSTAQDEGEIIVEVRQLAAALVLLPDARLVHSRQPVLL